MLYKHKIILSYLYFRTKKLNFIEKYVIGLINWLNNVQLLFLYVIKLFIGEDIRFVEVNISDDNLISPKIYIINIETNYFKSDTIRLLWKWKFTGFNLDDLGKNATIHFQHNRKNYILYINEEKKYYFYNIDDEKTSDVYDIEFDQINFHLDF